MFPKAVQHSFCRIVEQHSRNVFFFKLTFLYKLITIIDRIVDNGDTVLVIEHNLDVLKCAHHIIDLGPDGGDRCGTVVITGTPEEVAASGKGYTSEYVRLALGGYHGQ